MLAVNTEVISRSCTEFLEIHGALSYSVLLGETL
jgi:hypothetical protein